VVATARGERRCGSDEDERNEGAADGHGRMVVNRVRDRARSRRSRSRATPRSSPTRPAPPEPSPPTPPPVPPPPPPAPPPPTPPPTTTPGAPAGRDPVPPCSRTTVPVWASHTSALATRCHAELSPAGSRKWISVAVGRTRPSGSATVTGEAQVCRYQPPSGCG